MDRTLKPTKILPATSAIVVRADHRILVQQRSDNRLWGLPGGAVDIGESLVDAVRREVREESGYDVEVVRMSGIYSDPADQIVSYPDGNVIHYVSANFECRVVAGSPRVDDESLQQRWVDARQLPRPFVVSQKVRVVDWLEGRIEPFVR